MKKIFAIALAAVMVLSMASAFALNACSTNFAWPCDAEVNYCGRGTVEIVPIVKVNNACGGFDYQINTCAGAVASNDIYWAVKLNVEANPDAEINDDATNKQEAYWWDEATLSVVSSATTKAGNPVVKQDEDITDQKFTFADTEGIDWDADKAKSYYLVNEDSTLTTDWVDVTDEDLSLADVVFKGTVDADADASKAKVCAVLESVWALEDAEDTTQWTWYYGDYTVVVGAGYLKVTEGTTNSYEYTVTDTEETLKASSDKFADEVEALFNLNGCTLGTCLTWKNVNKNFGWDFSVESETEIEDCFTWSAEAAAIVDAECVVAIPKTGDASLLAWLF